MGKGIGHKVGEPRTDNGPLRLADLSRDLVATGVVDDEANPTLGDDVGSTIAVLNGNHGLGTLKPSMGC